MKTVDSIMSEESAQLEIVPAGTHNAVLVAVYDIGTHVNPVFKRTSKKVVLTFETSAGRLLSKIFTNTLAEKGNLRPFLLGWLGKLDGNLDLVKLIGRPATLVVIHEVRNQKTWANIHTAIPSRDPFQPTKKMGWFSVNSLESHADLETAVQKDEVPEWIADKIKESVEYAKLGAPAAASDASPFNDDDIPM